ncbi:MULTISPECIES: hypothetical protein [Kamptonema]|uniref:hypothetical protein n=1 Tax=Kamptonema TaxID=1501433 RepID=UPI0001DAC1A9|nr:MULTISPECIES: hypothetical protein [Kamptonema]CBN58433.1 hypothetical protein OSCI_3770019 [Kamptonema sp. PCC 6506]
MPDSDLKGDRRIIEAAIAEMLLLLTWNISAKERTADWVLTIRSPPESYDPEDNYLCGA